MKELQILLGQWAILEPGCCKLSDPLLGHYLIGVINFGQLNTYVITSTYPDVDEFMQVEAAVTQAIIARSEVISMAWSKERDVWQVWLTPDQSEGFRPMIETAHKRCAIALLSAYLKAIAPKEIPAKA